MNRLTDQLKQMGFDMDSLAKQLEAEGTEKQKLATSLDEMRRALDEYKERAEQLEQIRKRFELLKSRLKKLTDLGLKVEIRNNRMAIRLPGDVLFVSGQDKLQPQGEEVLKAVAALIRADGDLSRRCHQIAGHTDSIPLQGGQFRDNWGLSVMRARSVLIYLVSPVEAKTGGGELTPTHLHAAGYGETDPISDNTSGNGRQRSPRCCAWTATSAGNGLDRAVIADADGPLLEQSPNGALERLLAEAEVRADLLR